MKQHFSALQWVVKCALVAVALLFVWRQATLLIGYNLQQPATTARDGSLITLNRYIQEPTPEVALVGSSIAWRLKEEYFSIPSVRNLALAGGSPTTALTIIANQNKLPKIVLVETNVLSRPADGELIGKFSGPRAHAPFFLRPLRTAVAAYETWAHAPLDRARARAATAQLLTRPPSDFDNQVYVERMLQGMNAEDPSDMVHQNVERLKRLIEDIEQRGSRAFLIEVPFAAPIERSRSVQITKRITHESFPNPQSWLAIAAPREELRWADGVHLDERSALIVVQSLEKALRGSSEPAHGKIVTSRE
jgi:hypothetical protein